MYKTVIIAGGEILDYQWHKQIVNDAELIICADSGGRHAYAMGVIPHYIIGDLDSIGSNILSFFEQRGAILIEDWCRAQVTDTDLAVQFAIDKGASELIIIGGLGLRFDHCWANISLLVPLLETGIPVSLVNETNLVKLTKRHCQIYGQVGDKVSLLPVTPIVKGVHTRGLKYDFSNSDLTMGTSIGIGNELNEISAEVILNDGILAVIQSKD